MKTIKFSELPLVGHLIDDGIFAGVITSTDGDHHAVVLLPDIPDAYLAWQAAMDWAESVNGVLPSRPVAGLLFANLKSKFKPEWHWTSESSAHARSAWDQYFGNGCQNTADKDIEFRARAVRLIEVTA